MHRLGFIIIMVVAAALGLLIGILNHDIVPIDLLWLQIRWPLGLTLIGVLALGVLIGYVMCWLLSVLPLRLRFRRSRRETAARNGPAAGPDA